MMIESMTHLLKEGIDIIKRRTRNSSSEEKILMRKFKSLCPTIQLVFLRVVIMVSTTRSLILQREEWMNKYSTLLLMHSPHLILDKGVLCHSSQMVLIHLHLRVLHSVKELIIIRNTESLMLPREEWMKRFMDS